MKGKASEEMGMAHWTIELPSDVPEARLLQEIGRLNSDPKVHGILVQQPLPDQISVDKAVSAVSPLKDVDCFHPVNVGLVLIGRPRFAPATPSGVIELLMRSGYDPSGRDVVIVGRSNIVGKPLAALLMQKGPKANATVTVVHSGTHELSAHTRRAEIRSGLVLIGRPRFAPATPSGVIELLMRSGYDPSGRDVVIVGRSNIVGKPLAALLMQKGPKANATVTVVHSGTHELSAHTRRAEI